MVTTLAILAAVLLVFNLVLFLDLQTAEKDIKALSERVNWDRRAGENDYHNHNHRLKALEEFTERLKSATQGDT